MAGGAERYALSGNGGVGMEGVGGGDEAGDVDEVFWEGRLTGLIWRLYRGGGAHALVCLMVLMFATIWDAGFRWKSVGIRDDTEVAGKGTCFLFLVSLKREYSQLFVLFCKAGSGTKPAT